MPQTTFHLLWATDFNLIFDLSETLSFETDVTYHVPRVHYMLEKTIVHYEMIIHMDL